MTEQTLRFYRRGEVVTLTEVDSHRTLLDLLREDLQACGTKEGCGEGDCGACTVVIAEEDQGALRYSAVNSCIRMAHSINGLALWTVEDLAARDGTLHPVQEALLDCHGSQCGFCTPGFAMSLFGLYQRCGGQAVSRSEAQTALSGNLCRCTGYRPILDAAQAMHQLPPHQVDEAAVLQGLRAIRAIDQAEYEVATPKRPTQGKPSSATAPGSDYLAPTSLAALLAARRQYPHYQILAGGTDVGLWVTKQHQRFAGILDLTRVAALRQIEHYPHHIAIGAAATLSDAFAALVAQRPQLQGFSERFAGLPVRNAGTLGGNVANGSPIGDSMPLLIALGASVVLMREHKGKIAHRELRLEDLYTGYRKNVMAPDEVLAWIKVPHAGPFELMRAYKVSKRMEDDISAVCLALQISLQDDVVQSASIGVGGVAATPVRAKATEKALLGQPWNHTTVQHAMEILRQEFQPISDMRASADYRRTVLGHLVQRFWLESQGQAASLDSLSEALATSGAAA